MQAVVTFAMLLLAAVPSLQPFYTRGDQVLDPAIEGTWRVEDQIWMFARAPERSDYTLSINDGRGGFYTATLFKVGSDRYLDLKLQRLGIVDDEFILLHALRTHTLMRVDISSDTLRVAPMDHEKLSSLIAQQPNLVTYASIEGEGVEPLLVLTASTTQLKSLLKNYGDRLFAAPATLQRGSMRVESPAPIPPAPIAGPMAPLPTGKALNSAQVTLRAARVANDVAEKHLGKRPFTPTDYVARFEGEKWHWGQAEPGEKGYSTEVTMNRDGSEVDVKIHYSSSVETITESSESESQTAPPPAPIVPRER